MVFIESECIRILSSVDGNQQSIDGAARYVLANKDDAETIMGIWKNVFEDSIEDTKLYLFYVANVIFVSERNVGHFTYTPYFTNTLPDMILNTMENYRSRKVVEKILKLIRMWNDRSTLGKSMIKLVLLSIPATIFLDFPEYNDLNKHHQESYSNPIPSGLSGLTGPSTVSASSTSVSNTHQPNYAQQIDYHEEDESISYELPKHDPLTVEERTNLKNQLPDTITAILDAWETECNIMEDVKVNRTNFKQKKDQIDKMMNTKKVHDDDEEYEVKVNKQDVIQVIDDYRIVCEDAIHQYDSIMKKLETLLKDEQECSNKENVIYTQCDNYQQTVANNNSLLDEEKHKREEYPMEGYMDKRIEYSPF